MSPSDAPAGDRPAFPLVCVACARRFDGAQDRLRCDCGAPLDLELPPAPRADPARFDGRLASRERLDRSGVWRFRELLPGLPAQAVVSKPEGATRLYDAPRVASFAGLDALWLKHEGENPTGSFKDRGMTVAMSVARARGYERVACASTGNTAASMAAYAAQAGLAAYVFVPAGAVAAEKRAQAMAYGARTIELEGDFDRAMALVEEVCRRERIYLCNSLNPFRIQGQKTITFELFQDLAWRAPDWLILPGGNLGNARAAGLALGELERTGLVTRGPRIAVVQAAGAAPFHELFERGGELRAVAEPRTVASAIRIGRPVSWRGALAAVRASGGVVVAVRDEEILEAKRAVDRAGIGAEPASCAVVAGARKLVAAGRIRPGDTVAGILTGHVLKDAALAERLGRPPVRVPATLGAVLRALDSD